MIHNLFELFIVKYFSIFFGFLFYVSFIYKLPYTDWGLSTFLNLKRTLFVLLLVAMINGIDWRRIKYDLFFWCCLVWLAVHFMGLAVHQINYGLYLTRIVQILFIYVFVIFLVQHQQQIKLLGFSIWFKPRIVSFVALVILVLSYIDNSWVILVYSGFGGNRVNFSIWLAQIVFLFILLFQHVCQDYKAELGGELKKRLALLRTLALISPIIGIQVFASGRIGLMASAILIIYVCVRVFHYKLGVLLAIFYLVVTVMLFNTITPMRAHFNNVDILRSLPSYQHGVNLVQSIQHGDDLVQSVLDKSSEVSNFLYGRINTFSSNRLSILLSGLDRFSPDMFLWGIGVGNFFSKSSDGGFWQVHNIFVNHFGELGILGLVPLICITLIPLLRKKTKALDQYMQFFCLVWTLIAMLQPELILSQISTSLIYWTAFAYILRES